MASHVAVPFAEHLNENIFKVYFCVRDKKNRSHVTYSIIDLKKLDAKNKIHQNPILKPGNLGTFDDNGVTPSWIIKHNKKKFLFYKDDAKSFKVASIWSIGFGRNLL